MISNANNILLYGLVLAGGMSKRMGTDKGSLEWFGRKQRYVMADLLKPLCDHVFISCRNDQSEEIISDGYEVVPDAYEGLGPYGTLLSAFGFKENVAWLVVACDLPLMNMDTLSHLINHRDTSKVATTFKSPHDFLPEPLITIWEPRSFPVLKSRYEDGKTCPRKALLNSNIQIVEAPDANALINANTPEDMELVKRIIHEKRLAEI